MTTEELYDKLKLIQKMKCETQNEYSCAAEPPVQCIVSHLSRRSEPQ